MANTVMIFDQGGQECQVTGEFFGVLDVGDFLQFMEDDFWAAMKPVTSNLCELIRITHRQGQITSTRDVNDPGADFGPALPSSVSALISKVPAAGRVGRMFWPGVPEADVDESGRFTAVAKTAWQNAADALYTALDASIYGMYIERTNPVSLDPVLGFSVQPIIGTQRRRLR